MNSRVTPWDLAGHVRAGPFCWLVVALSVAALVAYLRGVRRVEAAGGLWPFWRTEAFAAGVVGIVAATCSGLAVYAMDEVSLHVVCHVVLMMTAPALLSLGRPLVLLREVSPRRYEDAAYRMTHSRAVRAGTHPAVVWVVYLGSMYLMLTDRWYYAQMMQDAWLGDVSTVAMVVIGGLYWGSLLAAQGGRGLSYHGRVISVLANMPFEVLAGIWLRYQMQPLMRGGSLSDTNRAGEIFIVGATLVSTLWLAAIVAQWASEAIRQERSDTGRSDAPGWTGTGGRTDARGWTIPWWVEAPSADPGAAPGSA